MMTSTKVVKQKQKKPIVDKIQNIDTINEEPNVELVIYLKISFLIDSLVKFH